MNITRNVMAKIKTEQIKMRPKWYFIVGSFLMTVGLVGLSVGAVFLTNLVFFLVRKQGSGQGRLQLMLQSFPWWIPTLAVIGVAFGIWMLKKYDFSYKKNFLFIVFLFIVSIMLTAFVLDYSGLNEVWSRRGPMRRFYQQIENRDSVFPKGNGGRRNPGNQNYLQ